MVESNQWLHEEYTIDTPENVSFGFEVAGIGSRFIGALIDTVIITIALTILNILLGVVLALVGADPFNAVDEEASWVAGLLMALYVLLNFLLVSGYYIIFELIWNGQTVGKRVAKIRVVRVNGNPVGFLEIVVRNLVRLVDFLPGAYGVGLVVMFFNRHARRLGDFAAGTMVIKEQAQVTLETLGQRAGLGNEAPAAGPSDQVIEGWRQRYPRLRHLRTGDYELIRETLRRHDRGQINPDVLQRLTDAIARKVETTPPTRDWQASRGFLSDVAEAYRHLVE
jgi:uncharacterized RDD family membrane protein YckC